MSDKETHGGGHGGLFELEKNQLGKNKSIHNFKHLRAWWWTWWWWWWSRLKSTVNRFDILF